MSHSPGCANPPNLNNTAFIDTAANLNLLSESAPANEASTQLPSKSILQPSGAKMSTTATLQMLLNKLPPDAREAHRTPGLLHNLVAASKLVDAGCELYFHKTGCDITRNGELILRGWRDEATRMWRMSLLPDGGNNIIPDDSHIVAHDHNGDLHLGNSMHATADAAPLTQLLSHLHDADDGVIPLCYNIYECENTNQLINFYHATMGFPVIATWCQAIKAGYFRGWPQLTDDRVRRFIKFSEEQEMGHMDQRRKGIRSTKTKPATPDTAEDHMVQYQQEPLNDKTNMVFMTLHECEGQLYSDQTGRFPLTSNKGNAYVVLFYTVDANHIKSYPIKSRHKSEIKKAYDEVYSYLRIRGYRPKLHKLDNETSQEVEEFITSQQATYQYAPPPTCTGRTVRNVAFAHGRTISWPCSPESPRLTHCPTGAKAQSRPTSHST